MALFSVDFYSKSLFRPVNFKLFVPNDVPPEMKMGNTYYERPTKILVLLHGYNGGNLDWALYSNASEISSKYNLAVILPSGENSFYLDSEATGHKYNTAILSYRLLPYDRYASMADMQRAIRLLRARKEEFGIGEKIVVMGFSAGGMICGNCATHFDNGSQTAPDLVQQMSSRPDACVIGYGAMSEVSFPQPFMMEQPEHSLFGDTPKDKFYLATEKNVRPDSPPFFIWQTLSDDGRHGLCLAKALQDAGVPYELHIFEGGVHGLGLADGENDLNANVPHIAEWGKLCTGWLDLHNLGGEHEKQ